MQFDWLTITAQIVNFLVLVWLLQHFLYGPITRAMERREARIADRLSEAESKRQEALSEGDKFRQQQQELEREKSDLLEEARQEAADERRSLEQRAKEEVETQKRAWLDHLAAERAAFLAALRERSTETFFRLARRALEDLASADLETAMAEGFIRRLADLDDATKEKVRQGAEDAGNRLTIESRFGLDANAKGRLTRAVHEQLGEDIEVEHTTDPDLDCGIALQANSQRVSWSLAHYLEDFEQAVVAEFDKIDIDGSGRRQIGEQGDADHRSAARERGEAKEKSEAKGLGEAEEQSRAKEQGGL